MYPAVVSYACVFEREVCGEKINCCTDKERFEFIVCLCSMYFTATYCCTAVASAPAAAAAGAGAACCAAYCRSLIWTSSLRLIVSERDGSGGGGRAGVCWLLSACESRLPPPLELLLEPLLPVGLRHRNKQGSTTNLSRLTKTRRIMKCY